MKNLKEDKSSGDGWVKKMLTNLPVSLLLILQVIYNCILKFHVVPTQNIQTQRFTNRR